MNLSHLLDHISEPVKSYGDFLSITVIVGVLINMLPTIAALLTVVWTALRIAESTIKIRRMLADKSDKEAGE